MKDYASQANIRADAETCAVGRIRHQSHQQAQYCALTHQYNYGCCILYKRRMDKWRHKNNTARGATWPGPALSDPGLNNNYCLLIIVRLTDQLSICMFYLQQSAWCRTARFNTNLSSRLILPCCTVELQTPLNASRQAPLMESSANLMHDFVINRLSNSEFMN